VRGEGAVSTGAMRGLGGRSPRARGRH